MVDAAFALIVFVRLAAVSTTARLSVDADVNMLVLRSAADEEMIVLRLNDDDSMLVLRSDADCAMLTASDAAEEVEADIAADILAVIWPTV